MRLDRLLVVLGEFDSRQKAQEAIKAGKVAINDTIVQKPAYEIDETLAAKILESARESNNTNALALGLESKLDSNMPRITIIDRGFVSRAGEKLQGFLEACAKNAIPTSWQSAIDVGAARGGFSQVLLTHGVRCVCCVDVGSEQLHTSIATDPRVEVFERCDIRDFVRRYARRFDVAVCDVSFISIGCIIDDLCRLSDELIVLFKPQFEVGRGIKRSKRGVVQDQEAIQRALQECIATICARGFSVGLVAESSVKGKEGNAEFFIYACRKSSI